MGFHDSNFEVIELDDDSEPQDGFYECMDCHESGSFPAFCFKHEMDTMHKEFKHVGHGQIVKITKGVTL
jgi:hypothetical protein